MNEKFNKNAKVEQLTNMFQAVGKENALSLKILRSSIRLFVRLAVIPSHLHINAIFKVWLVIQLPNLDCRLLMPH